MDGKCVIQPAPSGNGKSTLTAALIAKGFDYCTDDLALLTESPVRLRPCPMCLGIKSGSWDVLSEYLPELADLPEYRRADKKRIRYFPPTEGCLPHSSTDAYPVAAMIFPQFVRGNGTELRQIARGDALIRMTEAGYDLQGALDGAWVDRMVAWIKSLNCFELRFDSLDDAVDAVSSVLR